VYYIYICDKKKHFVFISKLELPSEKRFSVSFQIENVDKFPSTLETNRESISSGAEFKSRTRDFFLHEVFSQCFPVNFKSFSKFFSCKPKKWIPKSTNILTFATLVKIAHLHRCLRLIAAAILAQIPVQMLQFTRMGRTS